jgi:HEAT repeat protein
MRFIKQTKLFFREGNSDKTYEIDLCEVGPGQYVVNFRYGKRGSALKEGSKTVSPVDLPAATVIYDALEKEKRSKGYAAEQDAGPVAEFIAPDTSLVENPVHVAILKRLEYALKRHSKFKTEWKTSRVIWKAGELRLKEAVPYITKLIEREDAMQRYASLWALGRCGSEAEAPTLKVYAENSSYPYYQRQIAVHALLLLLPEEGRKSYIEQFEKGLPPEFQAAIKSGSKQQLVQLLEERVKLLVQPSYPLLEELYIVGITNPMVREVLLRFLGTLPLKLNFFQHIRHLFKQAELRDDHELVALLTERFEREQEAMADGSASGKRRPYTKHTRLYLRRRVLRRLKQMGKRDDIQYVRFATAMLLQYDAAKHTGPVTQLYGWSGGPYNTIYSPATVNHPPNAKAILLNYILQGNSKEVELVPDGTLWMIVSNNPTGTNKSGQQQNIGESLLKKVASLFRGRKHTDVQPSVSSEQTVKGPDSDVPFLHLWRQLPQAFIQLLVKGKLDEIHDFALHQLLEHPDYNSLKEKMDSHVIRALLGNPFRLPQEYGLQLAREKFDVNNPSLPIILALLYSTSAEAREQGMEWTAARPDLSLTDVDFIRELIFCPYEDIRAFARVQLGQAKLTEDKIRLLAGKTIAYLLSVKDADDNTNDALTDGCRILEQYFGHALTDLDFRIIEDLLQSQLPAAQALAARLLLLKKQQFKLDHITDGLLHSLLENVYQPVRAAGIDVISAISDTELVKRHGLLLYCCTAPYTDVRNAVRPLLKRLAEQYAELAVWLVNELVPLLMRKETSEGLHADLAVTLSQELVGHLQDIDQATALRLLYSNYRPAQTFGVLVLEKYIPAESLTIKQVIAAGNHELQAVREWCWRFFEQYVTRIRYERDAAVALLDATWDDTRVFAANFFRTQFEAADWSPESLVAIADSVNPSVQAFGRELLTRFFREEDGPVYLMKLSQHPGVAMQLFATNYLEHYAADNLPYLRELEHYFRSVLSRVNKARVAKERIFNFLEKEALKSREAATYIGDIVTDISATVAIGDKARCIAIMRNIHQLYPDLPLPVRFTEFPLKQS